MTTHSDTAAFVKRSFVAALMAGVCAATVALPDASAKLYVFGDSLSDNGNVSILSGGTNPDPSRYYAGRFTNGWVWSERLANRLGFTMGYAPGLAGLRAPTGTAVGGYDFAHAGATAVTGTSRPLYLSVYEQAKYFLSLKTSRKLAVGRGDVAAIWAGTNDYVGYGETSPTRTASWVKNSVSLLNQAGVGKILVLNLPKLGNFPGWYNSSRRDQLNTLSTQHNTALEQNLVTLRKTSIASIISVDIARALDLAQQGVGGFTVTRPGQNGSPSGNCQDDGKILWDCTSNYLFYDYVHLTQSGHEYLTGIINDRLFSGVAVVAQRSLSTSTGSSILSTQSATLNARFAAAQEGYSGIMQLGSMDGAFASNADSAHLPFGANVSTSGPSLSSMNFYSFGNTQLGDDDRHDLTNLSDDKSQGFGLDWTVGRWIVGANLFRGETQAGSGGEVFATSEADASGLSAYAAFSGDGLSADMSVTHFEGLQRFRRATSIDALPWATGQAVSETTGISAGLAQKFTWDAWSLAGDVRVTQMLTHTDAFQEQGTLGLSDNFYEERATSGAVGRIGFTASHISDGIGTQLSVHYLSRLHGDAPLDIAAPVSFSKIGENGVTIVENDAAVSPDHGVSVWGSVWLAGGGSYSLRAEAGALMTDEGTQGAAMMTGAWKF